MSRRQREIQTPVALDLNALAAACNAACGGESLLWDKGESALPEVAVLDADFQHLHWASRSDKPGVFSEYLGELVFDALALAGAFGIDIAKEVERARKASVIAKVGK